MVFFFGSPHKRLYAFTVYPVLRTGIYVYAFWSETILLHPPPPEIFVHLLQHFAFWHLFAIIFPYFTLILPFYFPSSGYRISPLTFFFFHILPVYSSPFHIIPPQIHWLKSPWGRYFPLPYRTKYGKYLWEQKPLVFFSEDIHLECTINSDEVWSYCSQPQLRKCDERTWKLLFRCCSWST